MLKMPERAFSRYGAYGAIGTPRHPKHEALTPGSLRRASNSDRPRLTHRTIDPYNVNENQSHSHWSDVISRNPPGPGALCLLLLGAVLQPFAARAQSGPSADPLESALGGSLPTVTVEAERLDGLELASSGVADYALSSDDISRLPSGSQTSITDVLAQLPSVALDQNQQIHVRNTEGPQFQYQINGFLVPLDINTNPPFLTMLNAMFVQQLDLRVGVLPARYGLATGGVIDMQSKDGCRAPGGDFGIEAGQRATLSPSLEYSGCSGALSSYLSARETWSDTAFSSATPGPTPIHDRGRTGQALGYWSYALAPQMRLSLLLAATR